MGHISERDRVHILPVDVHAEVEMRARRQSRRAHAADALTSTDDVAFRDQGRVQVEVRGHRTLPVIHQHRAAGQHVLADVSDDTRRGRHNRSALFRRDVDPGMSPRRCAGDRSIARVGGERASRFRLRAQRDGSRGIRRAVVVALHTVAFAARSRHRLAPPTSPTLVRRLGRRDPTQRARIARDLSTARYPSVETVREEHQLAAEVSVSDCDLSHNASVRPVDRERERSGIFVGR